MRAMRNGRTGLCILLVVFTASTTGAATPYGELRWGMVEVADLSGTTAADAADAFTAKLAYIRPDVIGAEGGWRGILDTPLGIGVALEGFGLSLGEAIVSGSGRLVAGGGDGSGQPQSLDPDEVRDRGFSFDKRVTRIGVNAFYDIGDEEGLTLYLGVGYGLATIGDDVQSGALGHVGARYPIDPLGYVSLRVTHFRSDGPMDEPSGLQFDGFETTSVTLAFGREF